MMARAESQRRFDLDARSSCARAAARSWRAVNEETPDTHGRKPFEGMCYPIAGFDAAETHRLRRLVASRRGDQRAHVPFIRRRAEIGLDDPGPRIPDY